MSFKGDLHSVPLGDVLQTLFQNEKKGRLELDCPEFKKSIYCSPQGITLLEPEILKRRRFGDIVVTAGLAERTRIEECLKGLNGEKPIGQVLLENNIIDEETIERIMRIQVEEELFGLFDISRGAFEFFEEESDLPTIQKHKLPLFQLEGVVFEAARRMDEWSYIRKYIPDLDTIFILIHGTEISGTEIEVGILGQVDGRQSVRDISDCLLASPFDVAKLMATLVEQKKIRISDKLEQLNLAQDLIDEGEISRAGTILKKLRPNLKQIILGEFDVRSLADLFYKVGDILTATNILLTKVRQEQEGDDETSHLPFLEQAHRIAPKDTRILNELAKLSANLGDTENMVQYLTALAKIHISENKHELSIKVCEQILEVDRRNKFVIENMPDCLVNANNKDSAIEFLENMVAQLGKKAEPELIASIYRKIIKIDPARKDINEKLAKTLRKVRNKNRKYIHLAAMILILTGGVASWFINTGEKMTDMDRVAYASMKFAQNDIPGARSALLSIMDSLEEPDAVDQARLLLANIDKRMNQGEVMSVELEKTKYFDALKESQAWIEQGTYDKALASLQELSQSFDDIEYEKTTREEAARIVAKIRKEMPRLRGHFNDFANPALEEEIQPVYDEYYPLASPEKVASLKSLSSLLRDNAETELFNELITEEIIEEVDKTAAQAEELLADLQEMEERLTRLQSLDDLSELYNQAIAAEEEGRLDNAYELFKQLANQYGEGTLSQDFMSKKADLEYFFTSIDKVRDLTDSDQVAEAYDLAVELLNKYDDEAHASFIEVPVQVMAVPHDVRIKSQGLDLGTAPTVLRLQGRESMNLNVEREGYERTSFVVDWNGGAERSLFLNRLTQFRIKVGGVVEAEPIVKEGDLVLASRSGDIFRIDSETGDILKKHDTKSLSGVATPVVHAHDGLYFTTVEGELWMLSSTLKVQDRVELSAGTRCPPFVVEKGIVTLCLDGTVECRTPDLKEVLWSHAGESKILTWPVIVDDTMYCAFSDGRVVGLNITDGLPSWQYDSESESLCGIALTDEMLVMTSKDGWVKGVDLQAAEERWTTEVHSFIRHAPVCHDEGVLVAANRKLICIDQASGEIVSSTELNSEITTQPKVDDGFLCVGTKEGNIHYRRIASEVDTWVYQASGAITSPPLMTSKIVYVADKKGGLSAITR